ncbi:MAG TPA: tyrosine-type recombinase/integrase [Pirellulaceae bacterium]|jgi:integrase
MRKPFYKASHKAYYVHHNGKAVKLGKTESEAMAAWAALQGVEPAAQPEQPTANGRTLGAVIDEWLGMVKRDKSAATYASYQRYATAWKDKHGNLSAADIRPKHIRDLIVDNYTAQENGEPFSGSVRAQAEKVTLGIFAWAFKEELIERNTVKGYERKAEFGKRKGWINDEQYAKLLAVCSDECFRDLLEVLWLTGARPFEIFQVERRHLDRANRRLVLRRADGDKVKAKPRQKDASRTIYLSERAFAIISRLADHYEAGVLFRNRIGQRWTNGSTSGRMVNLTTASGVRCQTTGEAPTIYNLRHSFATLGATVRNIDIATMAKLLGHKSTKMLLEIYDHRGDDSTFMLGALKLVA